MLMYVLSLELGSSCTSPKDISLLVKRCEKACILLVQHLILAVNRAPSACGRANNEKHEVAVGC